MRPLCCALLAVGGLPAAEVVWPLERSAYFVGERVPLALVGAAAERARVELVNADGRVAVYEGAPAALWLDTSRLAPGDYRVEVNGQSATARLTISAVQRRSPASLQDEARPPDPNFERMATAAERAARTEQHWTGVVDTLRETGLSAVVAWGQSDLKRDRALDALARAGVLLLVNPDTRPTSFFPVGNEPGELDGLSQRLLLTAQANARYPNLGGFCYGWDTTGYRVGNRRGLLTYWGWGNQVEALRAYLARIDAHHQAEFTRRTGLAPVSEREYLRYILALRRPDCAPAIDLPTKVWLEEIAAHLEPMPAAERAVCEQRLDAWSRYLMGLYREAYGTFSAHLRALDPSLRHSASVQVDHAAVMHGQYFPWAYEPLDFGYQSVWNDQVGGPDYLGQPLLTAALLAMHRGDRPVWLSNALGGVHGRSDRPGKLLRVAAQGLAYGVSGAGFALEGFSNVLGGMNRESRWAAIRGQSPGAELLATREFLDRFAALALESRGDHGVGLLFSQAQLGRHYTVPGFGTPHYKALMALARLGRTPCFVTEEDLAADRLGRLAALVVLGQSVPLPEPARAGLARFAARGGLVLADGATSVELPGARPLGLTLPTRSAGKPHNWSAPNLAPGDNEALLYARWHPALAAGFGAALGTAGAGWLRAERALATDVALYQLDGGPDARYVVAVNDSCVQSQADWYMVRETLHLAPDLPAGTVVYDANLERELGPARSVVCDLERTTARVFALLTRPVRTVDLTASQQATAGEALRVGLRCRDGRGAPLAAVVPVELRLARPDGQTHTVLNRATDRAGNLALSLPLPANAPPGAWRLTARCQLDGTLASLPVAVRAAAAGAWTQPLASPVVVRERAVIDALLARGARVVAPVFDSPRHDELAPVAERLAAVLAARGVVVEVRDRPELTTYTLAYNPTSEQLAENARADRGETIGRLKRTTLNGNDWYSAASGYRCGPPLVLLDLAPVSGDCPLAEALDAAGALWPLVSAGWPGAGRAVVQGVRWAFGPRADTLVIQASDLAGLRAGVEALAALPADELSGPIRAVRAALWREHHIGGRPPTPATEGLTAVGRRQEAFAQPFALSFPQAQPLPATDARRPARAQPPAHALPASLTPKQLRLYLRDDGRWLETTTVDPLLPDLRFSQALGAVLDVPRAGPVRLTAEGVFRYSDRQPMWQAQWEDIIKLCAQVLPQTRQPMVFAVELDGQPLGALTPSQAEEREVALELASPTAGLKPRTAREEVVVELTGKVTLPAGRHEVLLVPRGVVDGKLTRLRVEP